MNPDQEFMSPEPKNMVLNFSKINGTNANLDYDMFITSIEERLGKTCTEAELIVLNNFPVPVSPQANVDFLLFLTIPKKPNSYYRIIRDDDSHENIQSLIVAFSIVDENVNASIIIDNNDILVDDATHNFIDSGNNLRWAVKNYLIKECGMTHGILTIHPIFWLKNESSTFIKDNLIVGNELSWNLVESCISKNFYLKYPGYSHWKEKFSTFENDVKNIFEHASLDSATGFITKKKIERFQEKNSSLARKVYEKIGHELVQVNGKAGTGKTSDLIKWMIQSSKEGRKGTFLSYNHLLLYDVTKQIKSFHNTLSEDERKLAGTATTHTLHSFFFNLGKKLGVLTLMSEKRIDQVVGHLRSRLKIIYRYLKSVNINESEISLAKLEMYITSKAPFDKATKIEALDFLKFHLKKSRNLFPNELLRIAITDYESYKRNAITKMLNEEVFLKDYFGVLEKILLAVKDLDQFLDSYNIIEKYDLLETVLNLSSNLKLNDGSGNMDRNKLKTSFNRRIRGICSKRVAYIDEGQDCHVWEKEILFFLFQPKNIVVANGGVEQLIRFDVVCQWEVWTGQRVITHNYNKKAISFRVKPAIAALANHIANHFGIHLNITSKQTEDHGHIIISSGISEGEVTTMIKNLYSQGARQGCTAYESLLLLRGGAVQGSNGNTGEPPSDVEITADNVIKFINGTVRSSWPLLEEASKHIEEFRFWDATGSVDKREMNVPGSLSVRAIYYESCRGLEAWSTMCFGLDSFFNYKRNEEIADTFMIEDILNTSEMRKDKYAATWILMAITRVIDTCFINLDDPDSRLSKIILDFAKANPQYVSYEGNFKQQ